MKNPVMSECYTLFYLPVTVHVVTCAIVMFDDIKTMNARIQSSPSDIIQQESLPDMTYCNMNETNERDIYLILHDLIIIFSI